MSENINTGQIFGESMRELLKKIDTIDVEGFEKLSGIKTEGKTFGEIIDELSEKWRKIWFGIEWKERI